jgi:Ca2+/Na+ antiporter
MDFDLYEIGGIVAITAIIGFLFYDAFSISSKRITRYQKGNREMLAMMLSGTFLVVAFLVLFALQFLDEIYQFYIAVVLFAIYTLFALRKAFSSEPSRKIVKAKLEAAFPRLQIKKQEVKNIKSYEHFFSSIEETKEKTYETIETKALVDLVELEDYVQKQKSTRFKLTKYYKNLLIYLYQKQKQLELEKLFEKDFFKDEKISLFQAKKAIKEIVEQITATHYFLSIGQLSQIAKSDELDFHIYLQDLQLQKYSSRALTHAFMLERTNNGTRS